MEKLKTAGGLAFDCDYIAAIPRPAQAYIRILNAPIGDIAAAFSDKSQTIQIVCGNTVLNRYTKLVAIIPEDTAIKVVLGKE